MPACESFVCTCSNKWKKRSGVLRIENSLSDSTLCRLELLDVHGMNARHCTACEVAAAKPRHVLQGSNKLLMGSNLSLPCLTVLGFAVPTVSSSQMGQEAGNADIADRSSARHSICVAELWCDGCIGRGV